MTTIVYSGNEDIEIEGSFERGNKQSVTFKNETSEAIIGVIVQQSVESAEAVRVPAGGTAPLEVDVTAQTVSVSIARLAAHDPQVQLTQSSGAPAQVEFDWNGAEWTIKATYADGRIEGPTSYYGFCEEHADADWIVLEPGKSVYMVGVQEGAAGCLSVAFSMDDVIGTLSYPDPSSDQEVGPNTNPLEYEWVVSQHSTKSFSNDDLLEPDRYYAFNLYERLAMTTVQSLSALRG